MAEITESLDCCDIVFVNVARYCGTDGADMAVAIREVVRTAWGRMWSVYNFTFAMLSVDFVS
ncbi:hypothetical protein BT69DRAFT_1282362 [Atractiella rhizophila]|nr:hypothetical protein BT69DRAFT_1282362 [Atractiella rhizophila]